MIRRFKVIYSLAAVLLAALAANGVVQNLRVQLGPRLLQLIDNTGEGKLNTPNLGWVLACYLTLASIGGAGLYRHLLRCQRVLASKLVQRRNKGCKHGWPADGSIDSELYSLRA